MILDYKFSFQVSKCWFSIIFLEVDWEDSFWNNLGFLKFAGSITDSPHSEDMSLFYFYNSNYLTRLDFLFITVYQKWNDC
jgi:hypothetical protein